MSEKNVRTMLRWVKESGGGEGLQVLFFKAYRWKYGKLDNSRVLLCLWAFKKMGHVPNFVEEFMRKCAYPTLLVKK